MLVFGDVRSDSVTSARDGHGGGKWGEEKAPQTQEAPHKEEAPHTQEYDL